MDEQQQYQANLEALLTARTEQLREALTFIEELVIALKPLRPDLARKAVEKGFVADELNRPPMFGGKPGEPVPEVDPEDLKNSWEISRNSPAYHPEAAATADEVFEHACKPGADIRAIAYRAGMLSLLIHVAQEKLLGLNESELDDEVFTAIAKIPMKWIATGVVTQGFPFDVDEFLRLCGRQADNNY